jgi:F-type H+-transporting ATPase subunit c
MSRRFAIVAVVLLAVAVFSATPALAQEAHGEAAQPAGYFWKFIAAAFAIGFAAAMGALGQARGLAAACEAIGRNPGAVGPIRITMIIGLALIESLVIYALIIAFLILGG